MVSALDAIQVCMSAFRLSSPNQRDQQDATGPVGLRYALLIVLVLFVPAGWTLLRAAKTLRADWEEAAPSPAESDAATPEGERLAV